MGRSDEDIGVGSRSRVSSHTSRLIDHQGSILRSGAKHPRLRKIPSNEKAGKSGEVWSQLCLNARTELSEQLRDTGHGNTGSKVVILVNRVAIDITIPTGIGAVTIVNFYVESMLIGESVGLHGEDRSHSPTGLGVR
jgi:hypothetical protein